MAYIGLDDPPFQDIIEMLHLLVELKNHNTNY